MFLILTDKRMRVRDESRRLLDEIERLSQQLIKVQETCQHPEYEMSNRVPPGFGKKDYRYIEECIDCGSFCIQR